MIITEKTIMRLIAGQLYAQAPNCQPRKADVILKKVKEYIETNAQILGDMRYFELEIPKEQENKVIKEFFSQMLMPILEFQELNLSQTEFEKGIKVDDENRAKFVFTTRYTTPKWENDFVDLDAFISNLNYYFWVTQD